MPSQDVEARKEIAIPGHRSFYEALPTSERVDLGGLFEALLIDQAVWIYRKVEAVTVVAERRFRRQMSIDFQVPSSFVDAARARGFDDFPVPLLMLDKKVLMAFDLRDESGNSVPTLNTRQNGALATGALLYATVDLLGVPWTVPLERLANRVAETVEPHSTRFMAYVRERLPTSHEPALVDQLEWLTSALDTKFALMAHIGVEALSRRQIMKMGYEIEEIQPGHGEGAGWLRSTMASIGWLDAVIELPTPELPHCESYHFEFRAPIGLDVKGIALVGDQVDLAGDSTSSGSVAHVVAGRPKGRGGPGHPNHRVRMALVPSLDGFLLSAVASGLVATGILVMARIYVNRLASDSPDPAVTLLLLLPGIITALLARPGEHVLASRLLRGVRGLMLIPGVALLLAAGTLLVGKGSTVHVGDTWLALALVAGLSTAAVCWTAVRSWWQARARREGVLSWIESPRS